jgi:hypothetical protein
VEFLSHEVKTLLFNIYPDLLQIMINIRQFLLSLLLCAKVRVLLRAT